MTHMLAKAARAVKRMTETQTNAAKNMTETSVAPANAVSFDSAVMAWAEERIDSVFLTSDAEPDQLRENAEVLATQKALFDDCIKKKGAKAGDSPALAVIPLFLMMIEAEMKLADLLERQPPLVECVVQARKNFDRPGQSKRVKSQLARRAKKIVDMAEDNVAQEQVHLSKLIHSKLTLTQMMTEDDSLAQMYSAHLQAAQQDVEIARKTRQEVYKAEEAERYENAEESEEKKQKGEEGPEPKFTKEEAMSSFLEKMAMPPEPTHSNVAVKDLSLRLGKKKEAQEQKVKEAAMERALKSSRSRRNQNDTMLAQSARDPLARKMRQGIKKQVRSSFAELGDEPEAGKKVGTTLKKLAVKNEVLAMAEAERAKESAEGDEAGRRMKKLDGKFKELLRSKKGVVRPLVEEVEEKIVGLAKGGRYTFKMENSLGRLVAHAVADFHGVGHKSEGQGKNRVIVVFKPKTHTMAKARLLDAIDEGVLY